MRCEWPCSVRWLGWRRRWTVSANDPIEALLQSVFEGTPTDWEAATRDAGADRHRVESLRDVARIAEFNRRLIRSPLPGESTSGGADVPEKWGELLLLERIGSGGR